VEYGLLSPNDTLIPFQVVLPTSASSHPITLRLRVRPETTVEDALDILKKDLGLPSSPLDLVGPAPRSGAGGSRSRSSSGSRSGPFDAEIRWAVTLGSGGRRLDLEDRILDWIRAKGAGDVVVNVCMDEDWLFEVAPDHAKSRVDSTTVRVMEEVVEETEEEKDDTLKAISGAVNQATTTPGSKLSKGNDATTPSSPPGSAGNQARLSGLFHAWVDTNQHPVPPSTPQLTLVSSETTSSLAEQLHQANQDHFFVSSLTEGIDADSTSDLATPTKRSSLDHSRPVLGSSPRTPIAKPFISLSTATGSSITRLLSQNTGGSTSSSSTPAASVDTWGSRFALPSLGLGTWAGSPVITPNKGQLGGHETGSLRSIAMSSEGGSMSMNGSTKPLKKQMTGGLWSWWTGANKPEEGSAEAYVEGLSHE
jgi:hypothetical protein